MEAVVPSRDVEAHDGILAVEEARSLADLRACENEWESLLRTAPNANFFLSREWLMSWLEAFGSGAAIRFLLVRKEGKLVGLAPFLEDPKGQLWCRRSFVFPVNLQSHTCDVLNAADSPEVLRAVLSHIGHQPAPVRLGLKHIEKSSLLAESLDGIARTLGMSTLQRSETEWRYVRMAGSWDEYLQAKPSHFRTELRRKARKIEKAGRLEFACLSSPQECDGALEGVLRVESKSWKEATRTSFGTENGVAGFFQALARRCAETGKLRIYLLYLDGEPVAHVFGVEFRKKYLALKTSYDQKYKPLSPGAVLVAHALQDSFQRGLEIFDFLGDASRWKDEMATGEGTRVDLCVFNRSLLSCRACQLARKRLKPLVKRYFPALVAARRACSSALRRSKGNAEQRTRRS
jgi:CelD/BcsL family acetyltransferase involved in cellulose biosynthesis